MKFIIKKLLLISCLISPHQISFPLTEQELKNKYDKMVESIASLDGLGFKRIISELSADDLRTLQEKTTENPQGFDRPSLKNLINQQKKETWCVICSPWTGVLQLFIATGLLITGILEVGEFESAPTYAGTYATGCFLKNGTWIDIPWNTYNPAISPSNKATPSLLASTALYLTGRHIADWCFSYKKIPAKAIESLNLNLKEALKKIKDNGSE